MLTCFPALSDLLELISFAVHPGGRSNFVLFHWTGSPYANEAFNLKLCPGTAINASSAFAAIGASRVAFRLTPEASSAARSSCFSFSPRLTSSSSLAFAVSADPLTSATRLRTIRNPSSNGSPAAAALCWASLVAVSICACTCTNPGFKKGALD